MGLITELRARAQRRTSNVYDTLFTRRVSIYITALLAPLGVSANAVSGVNVLVGTAACALIALAEPPWLYVGIALVHLFAVLDSVDGELARLRERYTLQGLYLEDLAAYTMINGMFLAVGCYVHRTQDVMWPLVLAVLIAAFGRNAMQVARRALLKSIMTRRPIRAEVAAIAGASSPSRLREFVEKQLLHYTNVWLVLTTLILVEQLGGFQERRLVLLALTGYLVLVALKELAVIATHVRTAALDRELHQIYERTRTVPTTPVSGADLAGD